MALCVCVKSGSALLHAARRGFTACKLTSALHVMSPACMPLSSRLRYDSTNTGKDTDPELRASATLFEDPRQAILAAALKHVNKEGWSTEALAAGAQSLGYPAVAQGMFERGPVELAYYVIDQANVHMSSTLSGLDLASMRVNERIKAGVRARLEYMIPYLTVWPQAMALGALPKNVTDTAASLGVMADEIWWRAGDRSTDMNWYSRRALLVGVYVATETFMLTDRSPGYEDTWGFLDRRLEEVAAFGKSAGENLAVAQAVAAGAASLATAGADLLRPFIQAPGYVLPEAASRVYAYCSNVGPSRPSLHTADPASRRGTQGNPIADVAMPLVSAAATIFDSIGRAMQAAGIPLPQPPPMLQAFLSVASHPPAAPVPSPTDATPPPASPSRKAEMSTSVSHTCTQHYI